MNVTTRGLFFVTLSMALLFGFFHLIVPAQNFERLHIFLFNLCAGGSIIIYFTEALPKMSVKNKLFFALSFFYAFLAYYKLYIASIIVSLGLVIIVELVRIRAFSFFPFDFFTTKTSTSKKFHHASLLCLSLGLLLSVFAILNHEYLMLLPFKKFELNTFFLGFSFPVSLIALSVVFSMMHKGKTLFQKYSKITIFWIINLGVIIFFIFILYESLRLEIFIATVLFLTVSFLLYLYGKLGIKEQQKAFLSSGIGFLIVTAVTGIIYIGLYFFPTENIDSNLRFVRNIHRIISLYGWNLSGLVVISRMKDFPIKLHSGKTILLHWVTVLLLAPMGYYNIYFAVMALSCYVFFLYRVFFTGCENRVCESPLVTERLQ